jgi:hypothetical protein
MPAESIAASVVVRQGHRLSCEPVSLLAGYRASPTVGFGGDAKENLLHLAPDIQEALLFLPPTPRGRDALFLAGLQPIAATFDWRKQRRLWRKLQPS